MRLRRGAPVWLAAPTRFAGINAGRARIVVFVLALLLGAWLVLPPLARDADAPSEVVLYQTIVDTMRHGAPYYPAAIEAQRAAPLPVRPFTAIRLPTLAVIEAATPLPVPAIALLLLCTATVLAWAIRLRPVLTGMVPQTLVGLLVLAGVSGALAPSLIAVHEAWAGPLVALSLALRQRGRWLSAVALGLCAMLIRETALLYALIMIAAAWIERERREALAWIAGIAIFAGVVGIHAHAVGHLIGPLDGTGGWDGYGWGGVPIAGLPAWCASVMTGLALIGWASWRSAIALRVLAIVAGYAAIGIIGGGEHAMMMATPVLLVGIVFAPDGLRDVAAAALDTRRITVTRVVR